MKTSNILLLCKVCEAVGQMGATQSYESCLPPTDFTKETGTSGEISCLPVRRDFCPPLLLGAKKVTLAKRWTGYFLNDTEDTICR